MPTGVLDVGSADHRSVRVLDRTDIPTVTYYAALSHCWARLTPLTLTTSNLATLKRGIADSELPKTFRDAVSVTRSFQYRYIWIDSL